MNSFCRGIAMKPVSQTLLLWMGLIVVGGTSQQDAYAQSAIAIGRKNSAQVEQIDEQIEEASANSPTRTVIGADDFDFSESTGLQLAQYPFESSASVDTDPEPVLEDDSTFSFLRKQLSSVPGDERGLIFSQRQATYTILPGGGRDGLLFGTLDTRLTMHFGQMPFLRVTPRFGFHHLEGLRQFGVPAELFDTGIDTTLYVPVNENLMVMAMAGPGMFTDTHHVSQDAFRMTGGAIALYTWSPASKLVAGFLYLGREDVSAIPTGGWIYQPSDFVKYEFVFPRPKVAARVNQSGDSEHWAYLAGEFGGNSWAMQHPSGQKDIFTYRDYRLIAGIEQTNPDRLRWNVETAFVFGRKFEFKSGAPAIEPGSTAMLRGGVTF